MPLNDVPLRAVDDGDREIYEREGAVCLRSVFDPEWIELLLPSARRLVVDEEECGLLPNMPGRYMARLVPEFRRLVFESPLGQAAAAAIGSDEVRFYFDEIFAKPPRSDSKTIWHSDHMGWPVTGEMTPSLWMPLGPVAEENCVEFIVGSHRHPRPQWLFSPNARHMQRPPDRVPHPDEAELRGNPENEFKSYAMEPGDLLVLHPQVLHYSSGNTAEDWRIAISIRVFGDDIRWKPRPDCVNLAGVSFDEMIEGEPPRGPLFPLLWSNRAEPDGDEHYPRGFATTWSSQRRREVNEDALFARMLQRNA